MSLRIMSVSHYQAFFVTFIALHWQQTLLRMMVSEDYTG